MMAIKHYILCGHAATPAELMAWAGWFETADRRVGLTHVDTKPSWLAALTLGWLGRRPSRVEISTVFLGLDHAFDNGPPLLFETLVFGGTLDGEMDRYTTWEEAEQGHARMAERVRREG